MRLRPPSVVRSLVCGSLLALSGSVAQAQTATATTDPVGFITLSIPGTNGAAAPMRSLRSLGLSRAVDYQGNAEGVGVVGQTTQAIITDSDAAWTVNQFSTGAACYLEITGPAGSPGVGTTYDIESNTATVLTLSAQQPLATGVGSDTLPTFRIRKHWTLNSVFGVPGAGSIAGGTTADDADSIRVYRNGAYLTYFYQTGAGWREKDSGSADQANVVLYPDDGLLITRLQATAASVVLMGSVKTGQTSSPIVPGTNLVGNPYAAPMTLADSGLYTGNPATGVAAGPASTADQVLIYNGATYDTYYYSHGGVRGAGWRCTVGDYSDKGGVQIPVGTAVIIRRQAAGGFNWVAAQHPAAL